MLRWWRWRLRLTWTFFLDLSVQEKKAQTREHVQQMPPRFKIQMWASDSAELNYTCKCRFEKSATVAVTLLLRQWRQTWCLPWWITYNAGLKSLTVYFRSTVKWTETAGCQEERENTLKRNYSMLWRMVSSNDLWFLICVNKSVQHVSSFSLICPGFKRSVNELHWAMFWLTAQINFLAYPDVI